MKPDALHDRLLAIVNSLPGAVEDRPWGSVHCKVAGKIFVGWGRHEDGAMSVGFKTDKQLQAMLLASDPRFAMAKYVGKHGWVDLRLGPKPDWAEVEQFIVESYRMIAPRKLVKELDARATRGTSTAPRTLPAARPEKAAKAPAKAVKARAPVKAAKSAAKAARPGAPRPVSGARPARRRAPRRPARPR